MQTQIQVKFISWSYLIVICIVPIVNEYIMKKQVNNDAPSDKIPAHYEMFYGAQ